MQLPLRKILFDIATGYEPGLSLWRCLVELPSLGTITQSTLRCLKWVSKGAQGRKIRLPTSSSFKSTIDSSLRHRILSSASNTLFECEKLYINPFRATCSISSCLQHIPIAAYPRFSILTTTIAHRRCARAVEHWSQTAMSQRSRSRKYSISVRRARRARRAHTFRRAFQKGFSPLVPERRVLKCVREPIDPGPTWHYASISE